MLLIIDRSLVRLNEMQQRPKRKAALPVPGGCYILAIAADVVSHPYPHRKREVQPTVTSTMATVELGDTARVKMLQSVVGSVREKRVRKSMRRLSLQHVDLLTLDGRHGRGHGGLG